MKNSYLLLALIVISCQVLKVPLDELDKLEKVMLYETTQDYLDNKPMRVQVGVLIEEKSQQHITIKGIFDSKTGLIMKKELSAWALKYEGQNYFNLGYSNDVNHWNSYAKFDIEGRYSIIIIDENSPSVLNSSSVSYGGGLAGVLMSESTKWGKNWRDSNGMKKKILLIDTKEIKPKSLSRNSGSLGNYLSRKKFHEIVNQSQSNLTEDKLKNLTYEEVIEMIKFANKNTL
jgi:hypothetical protein